MSLPGPPPGEYKQLHSAILAPSEVDAHGVGAARGSCTCCGRFTALIVVGVLSLVALVPVVVRLLYPEMPEVSEPCTDALPWGMCGWLGGFLLRFGWAQARCPRSAGTCVPFDAGVFELSSIANDVVEDALAYARTGSPLPESLHGIWWMDQWGSNLPLPEDPSYPYYFPSACDEMLVTFGEVAWDPATRCTSPNWQTGGIMGHWTFNDIGDGRSNVWLGPTGNGFLTFCFNEALDKVTVSVAIKVPPNMWTVLDVLGAERVGGGFDGYYWLPPFLLTFEMVKRSWGWDRVTVVGSVPQSVLDQWRGVLPQEFAEQLRRPKTQVQHYPVFQIVDGGGQRTRFYDAYLLWANRTSDPRCSCPSQGCGCGCSVNRGNGTSLVGLRKPPGFQPA